MSLLTGRGYAEVQTVLNDAKEVPVFYILRLDAYRQAKQHKTYRSSLKSKCVLFVKL